MKKIQKNKVLFAALIFFPLICRATITKEQFMALDEEKKWDLYVGHNACYQRIFKSKNEEIARLEELYASSQKWQNFAVGTFFISAAGIIVAAGTVYVAITNPSALGR